MSCHRCGSEVPEDARFCPRCGAPINGLDDSGVMPVLDDHTQTISGFPEDPHDVTEGVGESEHLPAGSALLIVRRGPNAGSRFLLDAQVVTAGRHSDSDIFLDDVTVSRRHAEFRRVEGGGWCVQDAGSLNGTYLNRTRIDSAELATGDEVQVGKFLLAVAAMGSHATDTSEENE